MRELTVVETYIVGAFDEALSRLEYAKTRTINEPDHKDVVDCIGVVSSLKSFYLKGISVKDVKNG
jgi:hypothetical protein